MTLSLDHTETCVASRPTVSPLRAIQSFANGLITLHRDRRDVRRLLDLSADLLADMDIDHNDVQWALSGSRPGDLPGARLSRLRAQRGRERLSALLGGVTRRTR